MSQPLDYRVPETSPHSRERDRQLRVLAGVIACLAVIWAVFGTIDVIEDETWRHGPWRTLWVYGSSYVIAIGLFWRALGRPSVNWCRAIWALSSLVQGAWVSLIIVETFFSQGGGSLPGLMFMIAFAGSTFISVVGLVLEFGRLPTE